MNFPKAQRVSLLLLAAAVTLLIMRTWIGLDHALPLGAFGDPLIIRSNKLSGWLTAGWILGHWSWITAGVGLLWEILPACLFTAGLVGWCHSTDPKARWPRIPIRAQALLAFLGLLILTAAISWFCFGGIPHVQDSIAQQFQAQLFAHGKAYGTAPPAADQLVNEFVVIDQGRWYAQYPPMQALLLALGEVLGAPWLIGPVAGALSGVFLYQAAKIAYGTPTAGVALALYCASPFVWFMSGEQMSHTGTLLFLSAALWAFAPALRRRAHPLPMWRGGVGALLLGLTISTRPLCGVAVAYVLMGALLVGQSERKRKAQPRAAPLLVLLGGLVLGVLPLLAFNSVTTGSPFRSGYEVQWGGSGWGFGKSQWGPPHTPVQGLAHSVINWDAASKYLFEWPIPSLLPLLGLVFIKRRPRMDWVLVGSLVSLTLAYLPYFFQDLCFGPRFLYAGVPAMVLLSARGLRGWGLYLAHMRRISPRGSISVVARAAAYCSVLGLAVNLPLLVRWYGSDFWGTSDELTSQVRAQGIHQAIVLIRDYNYARKILLHRLGVSHHTAQGAVIQLDSRWIDAEVARTASLADADRAAELERVLGDAMAHPERGHRRTAAAWLDYRGTSVNANLGFQANTPWPSRQDVIYAVDLEEDNQQLLRTYPDRAVWRFSYDAAARRYSLRPVERQITSR